MTARLRQFLSERVDASSLGLFRIVWGLLMVWEATRKLPKVSGMYSPEYFHFKYALFPFVEPLPEVWMMRVEVWVMLAAGILIAAGIWFRWASAVFLLVFTHLFLIEKLYYNNHFYLTILVGFLLAISDADVCYRFRWRGKRQPSENDAPPTLPMWNFVLLRGQIIVLYFFGGIAKLNSDWLQGEPVRHWFGAKDANTVLGSIVSQEWFVWVTCWSGLVLDLTAGFLLLFRRTRIPAMLALIGFHLMNDQLFKIGLFPIIGISLLLLFVDPDRPRKVFAWLSERLRRTSNASRAPGSATVTQKPGPASWGLTAFVVGFLAFQSLWPLRTWSYGEDPSWTEVGHCFSWRMMLRTKDAFTQFTFDPPEVERYLEQHPETLPRISKAHVERMVKTPHFILQYAHALSDSLKKSGFHDVKIRCVSVVSLNGRPFQLMIDPKVDLATASYGFLEVPNWIVPLDKYRRAGQYPKTPAERKKAIVAAIRDASGSRTRTRTVIQAAHTETSKRQ